MMMLAQKIPMFPDKYMENGLKPIETFYSDISNNIVRWAAEGKTIYYETSEYWYSMELLHNGPMDYEAAIVMRRFGIDTNEEIWSLANQHSIDGLGKKWLINLKDKRVPAS